MKLFLLLVVTLFSFTLFAQTLFIEGQEVQIKRMSIVQNQGVISAINDQELSLNIGENSLKDIPVGSSIYFQKNQGPSDQLKVIAFVINKPMDDQFWKLRNGKILSLNCGKYADGPAFIELTNDYDLLKGCKSTIDQNWDSFIIKANSSLEFFPSGKLKSSTALTGTIQIGKEIVRLAKDKGIRYHDNGKLFYFYPDSEEVFTAATELGEKTKFYQPIEEDPFAVMFHENGNLSTAILFEPEARIIVDMFGEKVPFIIAQAPIGFNERGIIDRISVKDKIVLTAAKTTYIRSTETYFQVVNHGKIKVGMEVVILEGEQLFLNSSAEKKTLMSYTEKSAQGLNFFNEVSYHPYLLAE